MNCQKKLELWVTSLSDTPRLQYYDVQTLEYRHISRLPMKNERIWSYVKETTSHLQNKLIKNIHLGVATSISWIISPFKFWTATIFLHAHLQVVYYNCVKFRKTPISRLGGVALTRYMDGRTGWFLYTPPQPLFVGGIKRQKDKQ